MLSNMQPTAVNCNTCRWQINTVDMKCIYMYSQTVPKMTIILLTHICVFTNSWQYRFKWDFIEQLTSLDV